MKTIGAILLCAAVVSAEELGRFGHCTFPDVDLEQAVDDLLNKLPASYDIADGGARELLPGLSVGNTTLLGLSKLEVQGAPRLFCRRGKAMLEISTHGFARFSAPWSKRCCRIIANMKTIGAVLLCAAIVSAQESARFGTCTFPDVDLEPVVDDVLKRLPESYNLADARPVDVLPGLRVGNTTLVGLSKMKLQGAPRLFCRRGKAMLEISTHGFAHFSAPWRHCSGKSGKLTTASPYVTLNMLFEVRDGTGDLIALDVWLTWLEGAHFLLEGVSEAVDMGVSIVVTKLLPQVLRDFWVETVAWNTRSILKEITSP